MGRDQLQLLCCSRSLWTKDFQTTADIGAEFIRPPGTISIRCQL